MSTQARKTRLILETIQQIVADGQTDFGPGHVADALRKTSSAMLTFEIRGEFSKLEADGLITVDPNTGLYRLAQTASQATRKTG